MFKKTWRTLCANDCAQFQAMAEQDRNILVRATEVVCLLIAFTKLKNHKNGVKSYKVTETVPDSGEIVKIELRRGFPRPHEGRLEAFQNFFEFEDTDGALLSWVPHQDAFVGRFDGRDPDFYFVPLQNIRDALVFAETADDDCKDKTWTMKPWLNDKFGIAIPDEGIETMLSFAPDIGVFPVIPFKLPLTTKKRRSADLVPSSSKDRKVAD